MLIRGTQRPERNGSPTKLRVPALELRLRRIVRESAHVQDFASLRQESSHVGPRIHRARQNIRMLMRRLRLSDEPTKHPREGDGLLHGATWRCWRESLQVEGKVMLDRCRRLHGLDLQRRTDVGQGARSEGQGLGVVLLPALIFGAQVEGPRMLEVRGQDDGFVPCFAWKLDAEVPRVQGDKGELEVIGEQVFLRESIEAIDGITERTSGADMFPRQSCQASCTRVEMSVVGVLMYDHV